MRYVRQIVLQSTLKTWMLAKKLFLLPSCWKVIRNGSPKLTYHIGDASKSKLAWKLWWPNTQKRQWVLMVLLLQQQTPNNLHAEKKTHSCYVHAHKEKTQRADLKMRSISFSPISKDEELIRCQMLLSQKKTVNGIHAGIACTQNWRRRVGTLTDKMKSHLGMSGGEKTNWDYA